MRSFYLLCLSRIGTCLGTMAFAGTLPIIRTEWHMDAFSAGVIQAIFSISNALALFFASWLSDYLGARRVYLSFSWLGVLALIGFACFAHTYSSAQVLIVFVGLTQGGVYTPAMMLAIQMNTLKKRGFTIGAMLAAGSFGYLLSVLFASYGALKWGVPMAFLLCATGAFAGAVAGTFALSGYSENLKLKNLVKRKESNMCNAYSIPTLLLLTGYIAHCWELLGSWAWTPSMIMQSLNGYNISPIYTGLIVACTIHLSGMFSTLIVGAISDHFNRSSVLIFMGAAGAVSSVLMGCSISWGANWVIIMAFCGSFFILGDSGVLSAAIADNVPTEKLGSIIGIRSLMGFSIGSLAPVLFGEVMDTTHSWEKAYYILASGGVISCVSAVFLRFRR